MYVELNEIFQFIIIFYFYTVQNTLDHVELFLYLYNKSTNISCL